VFCCFIDFSKAFDNVDYWLLFCKVLDCNKFNACILSIILLAYCYSHQELSVRWHNCHSNCFSVSKGVRQSSVLSPYLFRVYIHDLINTGVKSKMLPGSVLIYWHMLTILSYCHHHGMVFELT